MLFHAASIVILSMVLVTCLFLPFLPGEYEGLAIGLATTAALGGIAGLLLVPIGACWLLYEWKASRASDAEALTSRKDYHFALAAVVCSLPVAAMAAIGSFATLGSTSAAIVLALSAYALWRVIPLVRRLKNAPRRGLNPVPCYLIILPSVVALALLAFGGRAKEFSRRRAMDNAAALIDDIEAYRQRTGRYPESLHSEIEDYKPLIRGIERYSYEPSGDAYNVFFEQFTHVFGTREFVAYNKRDEQEMTTHNQDLLRIEPEEIFRGYHAVHDAGRLHWKTFLFD
jgi:hypothetical protein